MHAQNTHVLTLSPPEKHVHNLKEEHVSAACMHNLEGEALGLMLFIQDITLNTNVNVCFDYRIFRMHFFDELDFLHRLLISNLF